MGLISLEEEAEQLCLESSGLVPTTIGLSTWRERLKFEQRNPVSRYAVRTAVERVDVDETRSFDEYLHFPEKAEGKLPVIYYIHGGQFISGGNAEYRKLLAELAARCNACVVCPEYALAPESHAPVQLSQLQAGYLDLARLAVKYPLDLENVTIAGDDVGGGMAVTLAASSEARHLRAGRLLLFYPIVNANFDNQTYYEYAGGYRITREQMKWVWEQYLGGIPKNSPLTSPLLRKKAELSALPKTLILTAEADVTRSEGESLGRKLRDSGVDVSVARILGTVHDFVMLNLLDETNACRMAMDMATGFVRRD